MSPCKRPPTCEDTFQRLPLSGVVFVGLRPQCGTQVAGGVSTTLENWTVATRRDRSVFERRRHGDANATPASPRPRGLSGRMASDVVLLRTSAASYLTTETRRFEPGAPWWNRGSATGTEWSGRGRIILVSRGTERPARIPQYPLADEKHRWFVEGRWQQPKRMHHPSLTNCSVGSAGVCQRAAADPRSQRRCE